MDAIAEMGKNNVYTRCYGGLQTGSCISDVPKQGEISYHNSMLQIVP